MCSFVVVVVLLINNAVEIALILEERIMENPDAVRMAGYERLSIEHLWLLFEIYNIKWTAEKWEIQALYS